ncbi:hypothetical protein [Ekhidna sp. To15]|uniref:hypothetical protein n=1 Tax=Ekhidna sp. To15 TaxID=3395267 RepID=UPI003F51CD13
MRFIPFAIVMLIAASCNNEGEISNGEAAFLKFEFANGSGQALINSEENSVVGETHFQSDITHLIAVFDVSAGASVFIGNVEQTSGVTPNDFTNEVEYKIVSEDGFTETTWTVSIIRQPEPLYSVSTLVNDFPGNDGISVDSNGNIYVNSNGVVNAWNGTTIYRVTPTGSVSQFMDNLHPWPVGSIIDGANNLIVSSWSTPGILTKINLLTKTKTQLFDGVDEASGIELDASGNLYVMEPPTNSIIKFDLSGNRSVFATGNTLNKSSGITYHKSSGNFFVTNWNDGIISKVNASGSISEFAKLSVSNLGPIINDGENLYVTSYYSHQVFSIKISTNVIQTIAGNGNRGNADGYGDLASFSNPLGIGMSPDGSKIYVSEISPNGNGRLRVLTRN